MHFVHISSVIEAKRTLPQATMQYDIMMVERASHTINDMLYSIPTPASAYRTHTRSGGHLHLKTDNFTYNQQSNWPSVVQ